ncbi:MAG: GTP-binding protein, partial [Myxococcota bacterium]
GFAWLAQMPDSVALVSLAGNVATSEFMGPWWATQLEQGMVTREEMSVVLQNLWQEPHGDRRQEIVFIGVEMDEAVIRAALDDCLGTPVSTI